MCPVDFIACHWSQQLERRRNENGAVCLTHPNSLFRVLNKKTCYTRTEYKPITSYLSKQRFVTRLVGRKLKFMPSFVSNRNKNRKIFASYLFHLLLPKMKTGARRFSSFPLPLVIVDQWVPSL